MNKLTLIILILIISITSDANPWDPIKVRYTHTITSNVQVGLFIGPGSCLYLTENSPNHLVSIDGNQVELLISTRPDSLSPICDPLPPEIVDENRPYFELGFLEPGEYTLIVNYVLNNTLLPPPNDLQVYPFGGPIGISIPTPVPTLGIFELMLLALLILITVFKIKITKHNY